jgi:prolyl-tRNA editing enzyme YbaK/EbsC (Cys-tRNA(Pro) deacylase)
MRPAGCARSDSSKKLPVYLDASLRAYDVVYPAAGSRNSAVRVPVNRLEELVDGTWVDVSTA